MEAETSNMVCTVCSLNLREGISLKSHLQTHSKDKIEALLNKQISPDDTINSETEAVTSVVSICSIQNNNVSC